MGILTSAKRQARGMRLTTGGEVLKLLGVTVLATRCELGSRAGLWATRPRNKYLVAPVFGERTGMPRSRFESLWSCLTFSEQSECGGDSEKSRWQPVDDFVLNIKEHRSSRVCPSDQIRVEESMCKWSGQGSHWILKGVPMYVATDRMRDNGCEFQNATCGRNGLMLQLSTVTTAEHRQHTDTGIDEGLLHGTAVLKKLVAPWARSRRVVCAVSYFASVTASQQLLGMGLCFIGVIETATRGFHMSSLSEIPLEARGQHVSYTHSIANGVPDLMAVVWVDRERRYSIASTGSTLAVTPYNRLRRRKRDVTASRVARTVPQRVVAETYYGCCAHIDRHKRCHQDDLRLENKLVTHDWSMHVNLSLLGMCVVDAWLLYSGVRGGGSHLTQTKLYEDLAEQ